MSVENPKQELRDFRERVIQRTAYEVGGLVLITPAFAAYTDYSMTESTFFMVALTIAFVCWTFLHNLVFDVVEQFFGGGPASQRSHPLRVVHALSIEISSIVLTLPILMFSAGFSFWEAVLVDFALSFAYAAYAYVFHLVFDRLRPMKTCDQILGNRSQTTGFAPE